MSTVATYGVDDAATHAVMLLDRVRMKAYAEAIRALVRPGDVVVDVGAGTGVLAALAARAGARRVFAIERGPAAQIARRLVDDNGLSGVVEIVKADAREARLAEPPTVLLSETLGCFGIDENLLALYAVLARQAAPGFRVIPGLVEPVVALVADPALTGELDSLSDIEGLSIRCLRGPLGHRPLPCRLRPDDLASEPAVCGSFVPGRDNLPRALTAKLVASRAARVNAIGGWFRTELVPGVAIDAGPHAPPTHWSHLLLPIDPPLDCQAGQEVSVEVRPRVVGDRALWAWKARSQGQERAGDAMQGFLGDAREVAAQLGGAGPGLSAQAERRLEAFRAALSGEGPLSPGELAKRLFLAMPERYADEADAEQDVWPLWAAARGG